MRHIIYGIIGCIAIISLIGGYSPTMAQSSEPLEKVVRISPAGQAYIDPEVSPMPNSALLTYQAAGGDIYLARLDPDTGLFVSSEGKDILIDTDGARPIETFNGPEFGYDATGWALYYAKPHNDVVQIWRARLQTDGSVETTPLTSGPRHQTQLVSRNGAAPQTYVAAIQGTWQNGNAVYFDTAQPDVTVPFEIIENGIAGVRWVDQSYLITFSEREGANRGQVMLLDAASNSDPVMITNDAGDKTDPYGWYATDFGQRELLVVAIVDNSAAAVYRNTGGDYYERIATLTPPPDAQFSFVSSAEPFVVGGKSYISLVIKNATSNRDQFSDSEIWLFDLNDDPATRYTERCDSGEPGLSRSDPEVFIGTERVFLYYNVLSGEGVTPYETRRCASNLGSDGVPLVAPQPTTSAAQQPGAFCEWIEPTSTDSAIDVALEPHYVCHDPDTAQRDKLLVFFPGTGALPSDYQGFVETAGDMGLHAIGLSYYNPESINLQICPTDPDPNCHENARNEVLFGEDTFDGIDIGYANSAQNRLVTLLQYLSTTAPNAGWEQYLDGDQPRWDMIVVAGHSQGAGMAAYVAHTHAVARAILFAWVDIQRGQPAPWLYDPTATAPENYYFFEHVDDRARGEAAKEEMFSLWGAAPFGEVNVDGRTAPYDNAHILLTAEAPAANEETPIIIQDRPSAAAHNMPIVDSFTPLNADGSPILEPVWRYLLDVQ